MGLRDRLNRFSSLSKYLPEEPSLSKSEKVRELRERLDRLLEPKKFFRKKEIIPIEELVQGEIISTPFGETFRKTEYLPLDFRFGEMKLDEILSLPTYPAHVLLKDDRFKELDLKKALFLDT